jgi:hypothetical protein
MCRSGRMWLWVVCIAALACATGPVAAASGGAAHHPSRHRSSECGKRSSKHKKHRCPAAKKTSKVNKDPPAAAAPAPPDPAGIGHEESEGPRGLLPPPRESPCVPVSAPALPAGYGWVRGSLWAGGGPAPGIYACGYAPVTVVVSNSPSGEVAAKRSVGEREEWAIPLPPGTYSLATYDAEGKPAGCFSSPATFTVSAGQVVEDSVGCDIP